MTDDSRPYPSRSDGSEYPFLGLQLFTVLSGYGSARELALCLAERRKSLLAAMLERQRKRVDSVRTLRWASLIWVAQRRLSRFDLAIRGVAWLLPRVLREIFVIAGEYSTRFGVVGVFLGSVLWLFHGAQDNSAEAAPQILDLVGRVALLGAVFCPMVILLFRTAVAYFGDPRGWPWNLIIRAIAICIAAELVLGAVHFSVKKIEPMLPNIEIVNPVTVRAFALFFSAVFLLLASSAAKSATTGAIAKRLYSSVRIEDLAVALLMVVASIWIATHSISTTVWPPLEAGLGAVAIVALIMMLISRGVASQEWLERERMLVRHGVEVPKRGFSWVLLRAWVGSVGLLLVAVIVPDLAHNNAIQWVLLPISIFATIGVGPVLVITYLYVRRVNAYFEEQMTRTWADDVGHPAHSVPSAPHAARRRSNRSANAFDGPACCAESPLHATVGDEHIDPAIK